MNWIEIVMDNVLWQIAVSVVLNLCSVTKCYFKGLVNRVSEINCFVPAEFGDKDLVGGI